MAKRLTSVTIRDVSRDAGVSVTSVGRYIYHSPPVSPELSGRIQHITDQLDFIHQAAAHNQSKQKNNTSCDDISIASVFKLPLTTVRTPAEEVGRYAALQLFCLLDGKVPEFTVLLPNEKKSASPLVVTTMLARH